VIPYGRWRPVAVRRVSNEKLLRSFNLPSTHSPGTWHDHERSREREATNRRPVHKYDGSTLLIGHGYSRISSYAVRQTGKRDVVVPPGLSVTD